jgi:membrane protease YdiL (CAAX protease family)
MADRRSPLRFFLLVFVLSIPFAVLGSVTPFQLMPGIPVSALGFVCPVTAAAILVYRENGFPGVRALLGRSLDFHRIRRKVWYLPALFLAALVTLLAYALMRVSHHPVAPLRLSLAAPALFLVFFIAAEGEELGWSGYATDPLQARFGPLLAAILLGGVWAAWHIVAMVQAGQSPAWIAWGCLDMVATRVIMVWLYDAAGNSVFAVALYHAMANLSGKTIFPGGSYPAERVISLILVAVAGCVALGFGRTGSSWRSTSMSGKVA